MVIISIVIISIVIMMMRWWSSATHRWCPQNTPGGGGTSVWHIPICISAWDPPPRGIPIHLLQWGFGISWKAAVQYPDPNILKRIFLHCCWWYFEYTCCESINPKWNKWWSDKVEIESENDPRAEESTSVVSGIHSHRHHHHHHLHCHHHHRRRHHHYLAIKDRCANQHHRKVETNTVRHSTS